MESIIKFVMPITHNQSQWMDNKNTPNSNVKIVSATPGQYNNSDTDDYNMDATLFSKANIYSSSAVLYLQICIHHLL